MQEKLNGTRSNIVEDFARSHTGEQISACVRPKMADAKDVEYGYADTKTPPDYVGMSDIAKNPNSGCVSKATTQNPKDLLGMKKPSLTKIPTFALAHEAMAMMDGASKYGPYNWRDKAVIAGIYIDACKRHLDLWFEGQEFASDSGVHHLGHARACLGILLDALETGNLIDDRPAKNGTAEKLEKVHADNMKRWTAAVEKRNVQKN